ncbi:MAG TPA: response regulator transcription factor [Pseudomonadales bacterium]
MRAPAITSGLILEDIAESRHWLARLMQQAFPDIQLLLADSCQQARQLLGRHTPDIAMIDLNLPDGNGCDILPLLKQRQPHCLCVISTVFDDDEQVFRALKAGADGYLLKDQPDDELLAMLQGIVNNKPPISPAIARKMLDYFSRQASKTLPDCTLTSRETEILASIAKGYTVAKTAQLSGITYNTAASYVKEIYRKLNIHNRAEAAAEAMRLGLLLQDETNG